MARMVASGTGVDWVITRCITRSPVSSAQLKVSHREPAAVGEVGVPINVGSWRVRRVIQHESCPEPYATCESTRCRLTIQATIRL
jgi:hypothetical protein